MLGLSEPQRISRIIAVINAKNREIRGLNNRVINNNNKIRQLNIDISRMPIVMPFNNKIAGKVVISRDSVLASNPNNNLIVYPNNFDIQYVLTNRGAIINHLHTYINGLNLVKFGGKDEAELSALWGIANYISTNNIYSSDEIDTMYNIDENFRNNGMIYPDRTNRKKATNQKLTGIPLDATLTDEEKLRLMLRAYNGRGYEDIGFRFGNGANQETLFDVKSTKGSDFTGNIFRYKSIMDNVDRPLFILGVKVELITIPVGTAIKKMVKNPMETFIDTTSVRGDKKVQVQLNNDDTPKISLWNIREYNLSRDAIYQDTTDAFMNSTLKDSDRDNETTDVNNLYNTNTIKYDINVGKWNKIEKIFYGNALFIENFINEGYLTNEVSSPSPPPNIFN